MNIASIKSYDKVFKQNSTNTADNKATNLTIDNTRTDKFISSKNTGGNKKNNTWKWLLGIVAFTALAIGLIFEKKAGNAAKAEKEAAEKAKKELEERLTKEKEELEKKLKEEQKKWDDFFNNLKENSAKDEKKAPPSNNPTSSNNTNITSGNDSGSSSSNLSKSGKNSGQSINTEPAHAENHSGNTSPASQNSSKIETLKDLQEKINIEAEETQRMKNLEFKNKIINGIDEINNIPGLGKVIGYTDVKNIFANKFINPVTKNQKELIPNMIFMYGPKGTGKTFIANSVAEEAQCNIIHFEPSLDTIGDLENLKQAVQKAEIHYLKTNQRSVIIVDEIDSLLNTNDNNIVSEYKALIDNISNHGATIIGTTNHPQDINKEFYNIKRFEKLYLPPMPKGDMPEMIKHYADIIAAPSVNYSELAELICQRAGEGAYSNDRIASIIKHKSKSINNLLEDGATPQMLTHQHLVDAINESTPDISKEILESYKRV